MAIDSYTETKRVYTCTAGSVTLHEETGVIRLSLRSDWLQAEVIKELAKLLADVVTTARSS